MVCCSSRLDAIQNKASTPELGKYIWVWAISERQPRPAAGRISGHATVDEVTYMHVRRMYFAFFWATWGSFPRVATARARTTLPPTLAHSSSSTNAAVSHSNTSFLHRKFDDKKKVQCPTILLTSPLLSFAYPCHCQNATETLDDRRGCVARGQWERGTLSCRRRGCTGGYARACGVLARGGYDTTPSR